MIQPVPALSDQTKQADNHIPNPPLFIATTSSFRHVEPPALRDHGVVLRNSATELRFRSWVFLDTPEELVSLRNANISAAEKSTIRSILDAIRQEFDHFIGGKFMELRSKRQRSPQPFPHIRVELYAMNFPKYLVDRVVEQLDMECNWRVRRDGLMVHFTRRGAPNEDTLSDFESSSSEEEESDDEAAGNNESATHSESDEEPSKKRHKSAHSSSLPASQASEEEEVPALPTA